MFLCHPMSLYSELLVDLREAANPQVRHDNLHLSTPSARFWGGTSILVHYKCAKIGWCQSPKELYKRENQYQGKTIPREQGKHLCCAKTCLRNVKDWFADWPLLRVASTESSLSPLFLLLHQFHCTSSLRFAGEKSALHAGDTMTTKSHQLLRKRRNSTWLCSA